MPVNLLGQGPPDPRDAELEKLRRFFQRVAWLTVNHQVCDGPTFDHAWVGPDDLGKELAEVDPLWYEKVS